MQRSSVLRTLTLSCVVGCGGAGAAPSGPPADAAPPTADGAPSPLADAATAAPAADATPPPQAEAYPAGPYGTGIGAVLEPFVLQNCNAEGGATAPWRFDGPDFFTSQLTVLIISAAWCVPCQREAEVLERTLIEPFRGRGVRFVQVLVQNADRSPISEPTCRSWVSRYRLSLPELMDPTFITSPFVPRSAFPGNVIIDRRGRIRWREYGSDTGLASIRTAVEDVLANPDPQ
ncbi:MAG: TlpA family protein disulfide reductase [Deltaproteobacteria bacterium]|nr:TlpA family protein disulfide reductase [Deltaproteobacteria bacterium]